MTALDLSVSERHAGGTSKVEAYRWSILDEPGEYQQVAKEHIRIYRTGDFEDGYQRHRNNNVILQIARTWSWIACGTLILGRRIDLSLWAIDGQARKMAADKRSDIRTLPCMIFDITNVSEEAAFFKLLNTLRVGMKSIELFAAEVVAEDKVAISVKRMVEGSGYKLTTSGQFSVGCAGLLKKMLRTQPAIARTAWDMAVDLHSGEKINDMILGGLFYLEGFLQNGDDERNHSIADEHNRSALISIGRAKIMEKINAAKAFYAKGGDRIFAIGIANALNHRRSSRRIQLGAD